MSNSLGSVVPAVQGENFYAFGLLSVLGTQQIVAAICDIAGNTTYTTSSVCMSIVTNASYGYNAAGCVTNMVYTGAGYSRNLGLSWNSQYQVTSASTNGTEVESYGYDALGRRVYNAQGTSTNWLVYDGVQVVAEVNGSGQLQKSYTWGPGIDNLLAMTVYSGGTGTTYYALTDHLGTVHALANSSGEIVESYRFDAFGRVLGVFDSNGQSISESAIGNRYLWQGREYSWKTGLYHFRARWYDPVTGRWLSNDPIGISGGLNQYVFCLNNPIMSRDPMGLAPGDEYDCAQAAAVAGMKDISMANKPKLIEYGGAVYSFKNAKGETKYSYNLTGDKDGKINRVNLTSALNSTPKGAVNEGTFHRHVDKLSLFPNTFSPDDTAMFVALYHGRGPGYPSFPKFRHWVIGVDEKTCKRWDPVRDTSYLVPRDVGTVTPVDMNNPCAD